MSILSRAVQAVRSALGVRPTADKGDEDQRNSAAPAAEPERLGAFSLGRHSNQSSLDHCEVEFIGGPLDGLEQRLPFTFEELAVIVAIPVNPHGLATLTGNTATIAGMSRSPTTVAFYELELDQLVPLRYLFLGAISPTELSLP